PQPGEDGRFTLSLRNEIGNIIVERTLLSRNFKHNDNYTLSFPAQPHSAGQRYFLQLRGDAANQLTVWGYDLDVYNDGALTLLSDSEADVPDTAVQDLRFITRYQLALPAAAAMLGQRLWQDGLIILLTLLFLPLPGLLLMRLRPLRWSRWDIMAKWGVILALGTAVWPLIWQFFSLAGGRFNGWLLWLTLIGGWLLIGIQIIKHRPYPPFPRPPASLHHVTLSKWRREHTFLLILLLIGLAVRLLAVRDLAAAPWVDASRHALITAVMVNNGRVITNYAPFLPVDRFPYHYGFHTLSASLMLMSGWELPRLLLVLGQVLNALIPLTVYTAVWLMIRRRQAALLAALLVALPFYFPAYYATWGRFTQLTAMLVMPVLLAFTWLLVRGARRWRQAWWVVSLLAAALFLIHFRVFLFYVPFVVVLWLLSWGRHGRWLLLSAGSTILLTLPRLITLWNTTKPVKVVASSIQNYNEFPIGYFNAGWDRAFIWLAAAAAFLLIGGLLKKRLWVILPLTLVLWISLLFLLLAGDYLGLPTTSLVNLNSMYITLFLPLAIFLAVHLDRLWRWLKGSHWIVLLLGYVLAGGVITAVTLFGIHQQINILNQQTILVQPEDLPALAWLEENTAPDAFIAVNSWRWLGQTWAGSDGGAWIVPLTNRSSSTPPADYDYDADLFATVKTFNEKATAVTDWSAMETAVWLQEQGISHIFVGARGGFFDPAALAKNPNLKMVYGHDGVFVFEIGD
ncbi:MAG: hypothetical protein GY796_34385, partial [Chloroflexi bacterium]|nr:hypothetical protein [Chloroflexota bacterium]